MRAVSFWKHAGEALRRYRHAQPFVQDNLSRSVRGSLSGLHFQQPRAQAKLVTVLSGIVRDVVVDVRGPTFGKHVAVDLNDENRHQILFAHGFVAPSESADFFYKCDVLL